MSSYPKDRFFSLPVEEQIEIEAFWGGARLSDFPKMTLREAVLRATLTGCVFKRLSDLKNILEFGNLRFGMTDFYAITTDGRLVEVSYSTENPRLSADDISGNAQWVTIPRKRVITSGSNYRLTKGTDNA